MYNLSRRVGSLGMQCLIISGRHAGEQPVT
jgi:hypothetical protein